MKYNRKTVCINKYSTREPWEFKSLNNFKFWNMFWTIFGEWEFPKTRTNCWTSLDSRFAGPMLFLLVLGTGPAGYFEDWWHVLVMAIPPQSPAPLPHPPWQIFPMCPVTGLSEDGSHGITCLLVVLGSRKKSFQSSTTGTMPEEAVGKALLLQVLCPGRRALKRFFLDPSTTRRQHLSAVLIREAILGRVTVSSTACTVWNDTLVGLNFADICTAALCGGGLTFEIPFSRDFQ